MREEKECFKSKALAGGHFKDRTKLAVDLPDRAHER
jgi:hypothetical protein